MPSEATQGARVYSPPSDRSWVRASRAHARSSRPIHGIRQGVLYGSEGYYGVSSVSHYHAVHRSTPQLSTPAHAATKSSDALHEDKHASAIISGATHALQTISTDRGL